VENGIKIAPLVLIPLSDIDLRFAEVKPGGKRQWG
jgi:hypothetical protein